MMESTSKDQKKTRELSYFRQRLKNRVFAKLISFFAEEARVNGVTKADIARRLGKDPGQITRIFSSPSNLTLETISDILLAMEAEAEPIDIVKFSDRTAPNYVHPLIARATGIEVKMPHSMRVDMSVTQQDENLIKRLAPTGT